MKMRVPAVPLITVDPYFSVWSDADTLNEKTTVHWTGADNDIKGICEIDGEIFRFMGDGCEQKLKQIYSDVSALVTDYVFENERIVLHVSFYTPVFADDLYRLSRPVSYMSASYESADGEKHKVRLTVSVSEQICLDKAGDCDVVCNTVKISDNVSGIRMGSGEQKMLSRSGDDLRIEWGYFYLCSNSRCNTEVINSDGMTYVSLIEDLNESVESVVLFAYDDLKCLDYFGYQAEAYWKKSRKTIEDVIEEAYAESESMLECCREFSEKLYDDAENAGGEKYAELLSLAYRQVIAAHKLALDSEGNVIFISKECFSNGCAATVDVTYPSSPFCLLYNTELLKGMLRPVFKYAVSDEWKFDFAPHDVGTYPLVTGQRYGWKSKTLKEYKSKQMPVEECGNMLVMCANISMIDGNTEFAEKYEDILAQWVKYLVRYGSDPENQLCTDDFAGHLAHNCNLSLKAIMGIEGYSIILRMRGMESDADKFDKIARKMSASWIERACNSDGSFRLAFDKPDTFSMKYNIIWDKLWKTGLFPPYILCSEFANNKKRVNAYGMPLDNRKSYTKSDWLVWTAMLASDKEDFEEFIAPLWNAYNSSPSRVPMTDWYDTVTSVMVGFRHRSVQGGLFVKLLEELF